MQIKTILNNWCPPALLKIFKSLLPRLPFYRKSIARSARPGHYVNWDEALRDSDGYDAQIILDKTLEATLKVKRGEAVFERDSVLFDKPEYPYFLIACLLYISIIKKSKLSVLDYGGALGSSFFQCRKFISPILELRWNVVEQPKHVYAGKKYFEDDKLRFYPTIQECLENEKPDLFLLSGVLHFIEKPYDVIKVVNESLVDYVIIDRQPLSNSIPEWISIKKVSPSVYPASFPMWVLSKERFYDAWAKNYCIVAEAEETQRLVISENEALIRKEIFYARRGKHEC